MKGRKMRHLDRELLKERIDRRVSLDVAEGRVGGASVLVMQNGETLYKQCFGADSSFSVNENTIFRLASMTKPITAIAALIVIERGLLHFDDPIADYLPSYSQMQIAELDENGQPRITGEARTPITIRHLLCHASGIGCTEVGYHYLTNMTQAERATLSASVDRYANMPLSFEPYSKQAYSPTAAFDVLARFIEIVTGVEYGAFLQREIFDPCEMKDTTFVPTAEQWERMIPMHDYRDGKAQVAQTTDGCVFENYPTTHALAGAGLVSTVNDYQNFATMLLDGGIFKGRRIVSQEMIDQMATPQINDPLQKGRSLWGLGVRVIVDQNDILPVGTFGWSGAYGTHFWIDRDNKIAAIYLKNSKFDGGSSAKTAYHLEQDVYSSL